MNSADRLPLRERRRTQTRDHLLTTASHLISRKGFSATSIQDIADAAGTSRATLYSHFGSKDGILAELIRSMWGDGDEMYRRFGELGDWSRSSIRGWVVYVVTVWNQDAERNRLIAEVAGRDLLDDSRKYHRLYTDRLLTNSELWHARFSVHEAERRAAVLVVLLESYLQRQQSDGQSLDDTVVDTLTDVWMDVLHA
ncbi:TetR/AcrR family transcriptional regulator [Rhodococcoides yunnanense]|uniref:TetR/AcrR family transcriptional regulator n=1 Tax=Rhodococcoides yunnanense TaxID=278209 RepID=UPI000933A4DA|nr:TetR/AcrR family transcriptional regulator [Rhodococcus yunnanensis]